MRRYADATLRNRAPILAVLRRHVRAGDHVLEIASGTGQHAVYLAPRLRVTWQPTDADPDARASIDAWRAADPADPSGADLPPAAAPAPAADTADAYAYAGEGLANPPAPRSGEPGGSVLPALALDVSAPWPVAKADVLVCVNMIHISPWAATLGLLDGAARLGPRVVYLYGPYKRGGRHTAPSNEAFEGWLKARDPAFGVRDLEAVVAEAEHRGFRLVEVVEMPANNLSVVLGRA